jgi:hypothetical protein
MKLPTMEFSLISHHFIYLSPNILLSILLSNALSSSSSHNVRDQISHIYRTTGKIIVFYILIFMILGSKQEDKSFWTQWLQPLTEFSLPLISS